MRSIPPGDFAHRTQDLLPAHAQAGSPLSANGARTFGESKDGARTGACADTYDALYGNRIRNKSRCRRSARWGRCGPGCPAGESGLRNCWGISPRREGARHGSLESGGPGVVCGCGGVPRLQLLHPSQNGLTLAATSRNTRNCGHSGHSCPGTSGGSAYLLSLELASRLRLTPSSAASVARRRWTSGGTLTMNLPLYRLPAKGSGTGSPLASMSATASPTTRRMPRSADSGVAASQLRLGNSAQSPPYSESSEDQETR